MARYFSMAVTLLGLVCVTASAEQPPHADQPDRKAIGRKVATIAYPPAAGVRGTPPPPPAIVDAGVKPRRARLILDDRFIGLATDFDGTPDYLFLESGTYRLKVELPGYATETVHIDAKSGYRYDLRFRLQRVAGADRDPWWYRHDRPDYLQRHFSPKVSQPEAQPTQPASRPMPSSREKAKRVPIPAPQSESAKEAAVGALRLAVTPLEARVFLDGTFLGTGRQVSSMVLPFAVSEGEHELEVDAHSHQSEKRRISIESGKEISLTVELKPVE